MFGTTDQVLCRAVNGLERCSWNREERGQKDLGGRRRSLRPPEYELVRERAAVDDLGRRVT